MARKQETDIGRLGLRPTVAELEVLRALVGNGKTTLAATMLGVSQPSVSRVLAKLEERLGQTLFTRKKGRLVPTPEALLLDARAAVIVDLLDQLSPQAPIAETGVGIRVAAAPTLATEFLPRMVARFIQKVPAATVQVEIATSSDCVAAVADGSADLGVVDQTQSREGVRVEVFRSAQPHVLMPKGHRLRSHDVVTPKQMTGEKLVAISRRFQLRTKIDAALAAERVECPVVVEATTSQFLVELVRARTGLAIINPFPLELGMMKDLVLRPFDIHVRLEAALVVSSRAPLHPTARQFADFIHAEQPAGAYSQIVA